MKIDSILLIIINLIIAINCTGGKREQLLINNDPTIYPINLDSGNEINISINEIYSNIELIPLETTSKSLLKEINKIVFSEDKYFILDKNQNAIVVFDSTGKFQNKIQNIGNGPGEYSLLYDFEINPFTNNIELLNPRGELLIHEKNGTFIRSLRIPLKAASNFISVTPEIYLFYSPFDKYKLAHFSTLNDSIIKSEFEFPDILLKTPMISTKTSPFNRSDSTITFFQGFSNTIYSFNKNIISPYFSWDFGNNNIDISKLLPDKPYEYYPIFLRSSNFVHSFNYFIENKSFVYTRFMFKKMWYSLIYDKSKSDYKVIRKFKEGLVPPAFPSFFSRGIFASVEPSQIQLLVNKSILDEKNRNILSGIKLEDNPVIIRYYFK
jgi:hypothetical protein